MNTDEFPQYIERPLDMLNQSKGEQVIVALKDNDKPYEGTLIAFDIHPNLILEMDGKTMFIHGASVESVTINKICKNNK